LLFALSTVVFFLWWPEIYVLLLNFKPNGMKIAVKYPASGAIWNKEAKTENDNGLHSFRICMKMVPAFLLPISRESDNRRMITM
jgi:hypothetical protein